MRKKYWRIVFVVYNLPLHVSAIIQHTSYSIARDYNKFKDAVKGWAKLSISLNSIFLVEMNIYEKGCVSK